MPVNMAWHTKRVVTVISFKFCKTMQNEVFIVLKLDESLLVYLMTIILPFYKF